MSDQARILTILFVILAGEEPKPRIRFSYVTYDGSDSWYHRLFPLTHQE